MDLMGPTLPVLSWRSGWLCSLKDQCPGPNPEPCSHHCFSPWPCGPLSAGPCSVVAAPLPWRNGVEKMVEIVAACPISLGCSPRRGSRWEGHCARACAVPSSEPPWKAPENLSLQLLLWLKAWTSVSVGPQTSVGLWAAMITDFLTLHRLFHLSQPQFPHLENGERHR